MGVMGTSSQRWLPLEAVAPLLDALAVDPDVVVAVIERHMLLNGGYGWQVSAVLPSGLCDAGAVSTTLVGARRIVVLRHEAGHWDNIVPIQPLHVLSTNEHNWLVSGGRGDGGWWGRWGRAGRWGWLTGGGGRRA